ncbi:hypothetical protein SI65_01688 [Aspergillus cristatus]|uniref:Uncharacterized protein n=1 Tax=Aspergillus cristatus TaxID=573508 RepID=A0A1E3BT16_ASPCR|nr:hypothetical protein SI65_01688 [Aspergillus cristatus]
MPTKKFNGDEKVYYNKDIGGSRYQDAATSSCPGQGGRSDPGLGVIWQSSFHYFWGGYNTGRDPGMDRIVMLTRTLRRELDDQVGELNSVIREAVSDVNGNRRTGQVHYVDIQSRFDGYQWCEEGPWHV